jgi:hypothetical protein
MFLNVVFLVINDHHFIYNSLYGISFVDMSTVSATIQVEE